MRGVFQTVPRDLVDASRIDGAGPMRTLLEIMLPIVRNGIVVVVMINFVTAWGEYLLASRLMNEQGQWTLPVVLASASGGSARGRGHGWRRFTSWRSRRG